MNAERGFLAGQDQKPQYDPLRRGHDHIAADLPG
jgi:hypothetical protein